MRSLSFRTPRRRTSATGQQDIEPNRIEPADAADVATRPALPLYWTPGVATPEPANLTVWRPTHPDHAGVERSYVRVDDLGHGTARWFTVIHCPDGVRPYSNYQLAAHGDTWIAVDPGGAVDWAYGPAPEGFDDHWWADIADAAEGLIPGDPTLVPVVRGAIGAYWESRRPHWMIVVLRQMTSAVNPRTAAYCLRQHRDAWDLAAGALTVLCYTLLAAAVIVGVFKGTGPASFGVMMGVACALFLAGFLVHRWAPAPDED